MAFMTNFIIGGIQQIGLGVSEVYEAWEWYRSVLGMDLAVFDEAADAPLMVDYTGDEVQSRHAILAMNHQGGAGLEIWQHTARKPLASEEPLLLGDLGINIAKFKAFDLKKTYRRLLKRGVELRTEPNTYWENHSFFADDPWGNWLEIIPGRDWFKHSNDGNGGVVGCVIGVSDMEQSLAFYGEILGYYLVAESPF